jgi:hypothetical protein
MIEVVNAFLSGDHGECSSIEQGSDNSRVVQGQNQPGALPNGYPILSYSRQISSLS